MHDLHIIYSKLKKCSLFNSFNQNEIICLISNNKNNLKVYYNNDILFLQNEKCNFLSVVLEGQVHIQKFDSSGNILIISTLKYGDVFGENLLFGDYNNYPMSIICKEKATILHISKEYIFDICKNNSKFLKELLKILSNKAIILSSKLSQISMKSLRQMICSFLITEYTVQKTKKIKLGMTKKELAEKLGVQRPSLSREFMNMKKDNLIDYDKNYIILLELDTIKAQI